MSVGEAPEPITVIARGTRPLPPTAVDGLPSIDGSPRMPHTTAPLVLPVAMLSMLSLWLASGQMLTALSRATQRRLVFVSTSAVFGESGALLHEDYGPLQPISFYGARKLGVRRMIEDGL
jgi:hypothetical protein